LNHEIVRSLNIPDQVIEQVTTKEQQELMRRDRLYRGDRPAMDVRDRIVILVDDGLATGSTMQAAVTAVKQQQPAQIVVAVPLAVSEVCDRFQQQVDEVVCLMSPEPFHAVGLWYKDFSQTADQEVQKLLQEAVCA
jgi:putative phosphoribosyl transferase